MAYRSTVNGEPHAVTAAPETSLLPNDLQRHRTANAGAANDARRMKAPLS
jgi:hypothetical protein